MSFTCDSCDAKIIDSVGEHMKIRRPPRITKGDKQRGDLDLHLCTECYLGAQEFTVFWQFIVTKQFMKERMKQIKPKKRNDWNRDWREGRGEERPN
jgi:hypothetical protein